MDLSQTPIFFDMLTNVLLDVEATISIGTGVPILININRLAEGDYDIFCPQSESLFEG